MLLSVAIFSRENVLIYFATTDKRECDEVQLQRMVYSSMDVLEERERAASSRPQELYHGCLLSDNDYKTFGYVTNTKVKFLLVFDIFDTTIREQDIRSYFKKLHSAYCVEVANPFFQHGCIISTNRFARFIGSLFN